jgi:PKD repeat protein
MSKQFLTVKLKLLLLSVAIIHVCEAQHLFLEECFTGGITSAGKGSLGILDGSFEIYWDENKTLRRAYAITYSYSNPEPRDFIIENGIFTWNDGNQVGSDLEGEQFTHPVAVHIQDITDAVGITDNSISVYMNGEDVSSAEPNRGWWGIMCVFLYEDKTVDTEVCLRIYAADQSQAAPQNYSIITPEWDLDQQIGFALFADRLGGDQSDNSIVGINGELLGEIGSPALNGDHGHFYYENGNLFGLDNDLANNTVSGNDQIAVINDYLSNGINQQIYFSALNYPPSGAANPHPAFFLTYTPDCAILPDLADIPREFSFCRGDTVMLDITNAYSLYSWSESAGLSDSTSASPLCFADSSGWYTVKMWNEGEEGCSQTIPIFIEVNDIPAPAELNVNPSSCPEPSGLIQAIDPAGRSPHRYRLDGELQSGNSSTNLAAGIYDYQISSAAGCVWDTTVAVGLDPLQEADFDPFPTTGFSPLFVAFANTSTQATGFQWLIDGEPISQNEDLTYTFPDSGSFEVSLIAYRLEESCADTATFTLRVEPGVSVLMPNIFSPNGDGRNDVLVAQVQGVASCRWVIYNRWGNEVLAGSIENGFESVELWSPDSDIPAGQYTVVVVVEGLAGQVERLSFEVAVVR